MKPSGLSFIPHNDNITMGQRIEKGTQKFYNNNHPTCVCGNLLWM